MDRQAVIDALMQVDGPTMEFRVDRPPMPALADGHHRTGSTGELPGFSLEALRALSDEVWTWVGTRILRETDASGQMPQHMKVTVTVEFTDAERVPEVKEST